MRKGKAMKSFEGKDKELVLELWVVIAWIECQDIWMILVAERWVEGELETFCWRGEEPSFPNDGNGEAAWLDSSLPVAQASWLFYEMDNGVVN